MATRRLTPVAWTEGMLLRPQHLQHHDVFLEDRLRYHLRSLNPFHWGVRELQVDEEALSDGRLEVVRLDAILPGGMIVQVPGNAMIEPREFPSEVETLTVHLALRTLQVIEPNASADEEAQDVRYYIRSEEVPDLNRGGHDAPIELAMPRLRLFFGGEETELDVHESFRLGEIRATGQLNRPFAWSQEVVPPLLAIQAAAGLNEEIQSIVSQIAAKVRVVAGRTSTAAMGNIHLLWMRYTLSRMTAVLRHLLSTGETHPFDIYSALVETAGALSAFRHEEPIELPLYDHEDLWTCFHELLRLIEIELEATAPVKFAEFPLAFDPEKKLYGTTELKVEHVDPRNTFYLGVQAPLDAQELARWVVAEGKASSIAGVAPLVILATAGLRVEHLPGPPTDIATRPGFEYFKVDPHGEQWAHVRDDYSFGISLGKLEHAEARLYAVLPE
jgi:type VI secretion system protein ImpJ